MENGNALNCLYPKAVSKSIFENTIKELKNLIHSNNLKSINKYEEIPYYFEWKENTKMPSIADVMRMYVAIDFILSNKTPKEFDKKASYERFLNNDDEIKTFLKEVILYGKSERFKDKNIDIVKGGFYKIKKYFLENNKIKDIRGASQILNYLNGEGTINIVKDYIIEECIIYCGGGNVFLISPYETGEKISMALENEYTDVSLTAMNAFESISCSINSFLCEFNLKSYEVNEKLEERKKIKLYEPNPDKNIDCFKKIGVEIKNFNKNTNLKSVCSLCGVRDAIYTIEENSNVINVCPSCLRKHMAGYAKTTFFNEYESFTNINMNYKKQITDLDSISDKRGIAVIYGDGNNMGNIVRNIKSPFEMAYFSRKTDNITKKCVYNSISQVLKQEAKFEVIALGGDDIFIIVPASNSLEIASNIVKKFDEEFMNEITMSVGVCISKSNTPIKNMFEIAQNSMKNAKKYAANINKGTIDVIILESNGNIDFNVARKEKSFFPITSDKLFKVIKIMNDMKKNIGRSQIYKLRYASETMIKEEFALFYLYQEARNKNNISDYIKDIFELDKSSIFTGFVRCDGSEYFPWKDITLLWDYTGGESFENKI